MLWRWEYAWDCQTWNKHLRNGGYADQLLETEIQRASNTPRDEALRPRKRTTRIPLVVTFNLLLLSLSEITRTHHHILQASDWLKRIVTSPTIIAFRCPKSLSDLLVHAILKSSMPTPGNFRCGAACCKTCPVLLTMNEFSSHSTGKTYIIRSEATCNTSNVIYLIQCRKYGLQYVGETGQLLHCRMNNHLANIIHQWINEEPVAQHFTFYACYVALKRVQPYSTVMSWLRCRLSFALLRSAVMCVRGSRSSFHHPVRDLDITLATAEGSIPQL